MSIYIKLLSRKDSREGESHNYEVLLVSDKSSQQMKLGPITKPIVEETILEETEDNVCYEHSEGQ